MFARMPFSSSIPVLVKLDGSIICASIYKASIGFVEQRFWSVVVAVTCDLEVGVFCKLGEGIVQPDYVCILSSRVEKYKTRLCRRFLKLIKCSKKYTKLFDVVVLIPELEHVQSSLVHDDRMFS